jgi:hypothetical protein
MLPLTYLVTMSLLTLDMEEFQAQSSNNGDIGHSLDDIFSDWIMADSFESSDSEGQGVYADQESNLSNRDCKISTKSKTGGTENISVAHSKQAPEAEVEEWKSIRCLKDADAASFTSPDHYSCSRSKANGAHLISLARQSDELSSLINRDFPGYLMHVSPNSSPETNSSHLLDLDGFQSLTIQNHSNSSTANSYLRVRNSLSASSLTSAMTTASPCRSLPSTQRFDRLAVAAPDQFNVMGGFLSPSAAQFNIQGLQSSPFEVAIRSSHEQNTESLMSPLENGYVQHPNTPVASPIFDQRSNSQSSLNSVDLGGFPSLPTTHQINLNMGKTPSAAQPIGQTGWGTGAAVPSPSYTTSSIKPEAWFGTDDSVGLPQVNGVRSLSDGRLESQMGLGIKITNGDPDNLNNLNTSMLVRQTRQAGTAKGGRNDGSRPGQNELPRSIDLSPITNANFSASALSQHNLMYTHMAQQMASQSRQPLPIGYDSLVPQQARRISNRASLPVPLTTPSPTLPTSAKVTKSPRQGHRRSNSSGHHRRRSSNNLSKSPRHTSISFVNFTPDDCEKIITGVAPSGSSKTKARREREAAEKRRKIGEVAKKAVLKAGGDLRTLEKEGLNELVEGSI